MGIRNLFENLLSAMNKANDFKDQYANQDIGEKPPKKKRNIKVILVLPLLILAVFVLPVYSRRN